MNSMAFISGLVGITEQSSLLLALAIIVCTIVLEDTTAVIVGLLAADGVIGLPLALFSLYAGTILGDVIFYFLGYFGRSHPRLARYVDHEVVAPFRFWLESRYVLTVFAARFIPGTRLATYTASGFFRSPFWTFLLTVISASALWTSFLFFSSYGFGHATGHSFGKLRYVIAAIVLLILFFVGRRNLRVYSEERERLKTGGETRNSANEGN